MSPTPFVNRSGWTAQEPRPVVLHCLCGQSFEGKAIWPPTVAQAFTAAWWKVHCGPGHGPSDVHVDRPTEAEVLDSYRKDIESGGDV